MARPRSNHPTRSVKSELDTSGNIICYRWSTYYPGPNGEQKRREGKVTVDVVLRRMGPRTNRERAVREAEKQAWAALEAFINGNGGPQESTMTVQKWSIYCLETILPLEGPKARSVIEIGNALKRHLYPRLGAVPLAQLSPEMCIAWWMNLIESFHTRVYTNGKGEVTKTVRKKICSKTAINIKGYFHTVIDRAVRMNKISYNPVDAIPHNRTESRDHAESVRAAKLFLTPAEAKSLRKASTETMIFGHVLCGLDLGTRINEANGLLVENLRLDQGDNGLVYVRNQTQRYKKKGESKSRIHDETPKSRAGYRPLLLSPELRRVIDERLAKMASGNIPKSPYVFANSKGKPHSYSTMHEMFTAACERAGLVLTPGNATHILRRFFLDTSKSSGVSEEIRAQIAGHERYETTALLYEDVDQAQYRRLFGHVHNLSYGDAAA